MTVNCIPARDLIARNYYACQIEKRLTTICKPPSRYITNSDITRERNVRASIYALEKIAIVPSLIVSPVDFAIGASASLVCGVIGSICFELRYPALVDQRKDWKDYFEATAILMDGAKKWLLKALFIKAFSSIIFSCIWPSEMAWYNSLVGLTVGMMIGRMVGSRDDIKKMTRCMNPALAEPLLANTENMV